MYRISIFFFLRIIRGSKNCKKDREEGEKFGNIKGWKDIYRGLMI